MRILIVEDNPDIASSVGDYLELHDHVVDYASDGIMGLNLAVENSYEVIILDINLPRIDGFELCKQLREQHQINTPVLMLTARDSLEDKVKGFELGAWDYLIKPFAMKELALRLDALKLRLKPERSRVINVGELTLNLSSMQADRAGKILNLHRASLKILEALMLAYPNVVSRQSIEYLLWGDELSPGSNDPLRSHMYELRQEVDKNFNYKMLKTIRGVGFVLRVEETNNGN